MDGVKGFSEESEVLYVGLYTCALVALQQISGNSSSNCRTSNARLLNLFAILIMLYLFQAAKENDSTTNDLIGYVPSMYYSKPNPTTVLYCVLCTVCV